MKLKTSPENCESRSGSACLAWWRHLAIVLLLLAFVACGSDDETAGGSSEETQGIAITDKQVAGVSQKGPFVKGSSVTVQELKNGTTLAQTGRSFKGKIASDKGDFSIKVDSLVSQYALLQVDGYYYNEISGVKSSSIISLNALTDLSDRDNVNINLLTHLAYDRVLHLVDSGASVSEAKIQAEAEIFNAFEITGDFDAAEDLNIFSNRDGDAALLAISVLLLGDRSEADLTELMTMLSMDMEKDGVWDDEPNKAKIADWASETTLSSGLSSIRANIISWSFGKPHNYEKYVKNFWYMNYKLGVCDESREGEVAADSNRVSKYYYKSSERRFECRDGEWILFGEPESSSSTEASSDESSLTELSSSSAELSSSSLVSSSSTESSSSLSSSSSYSSSSSHKISSSSVTSSSSEYSSSSQVTSSAACTEENQGEIRKRKWYAAGDICDNGEWREATNLEYDTYGWTPGSDGEVRPGLAGGPYTYDLDHWRESTPEEIVTHHGCTESLPEKKFDTGDTIYLCDSESRKWIKMTPQEYDVYLWPTDNDGEMRAGIRTGLVFVYEATDGVWRVATSSEDHWYKTAERVVTVGCTTLNVGMTVKLPQNYSVTPLDKIKCTSSHEWERIQEE